MVAWIAWLVWSTWLSFLLFIILFLIFVLFYYIISFLTLISGPFFCTRKGLPSTLEGGSPEFWRKESGRFFGRRKESFLLEKNRDRIKEKKGVLKKGETIIGEGTHGFDGEDFLHGWRGWIAEDERLLRQCEFFWKGLRAIGEDQGHRHCYFEKPTSSWSLQHLSWALIKSRLVARLWLLY